MSRIPIKEQWGAFTVYHPRYFLLPKISLPFHGLLMFLGSVLLILRLHMKLRFDCVDAHFVYPDGFAAVLLGKLLRLPVVVTAHGTDLNLYAQYWLVRPLIRWTLNRTEKVICVSRALRSIALSLHIRDDKIVVIPNGVDLGRFHQVDKTDARCVLGIPPNAEVVLAVGQLISRKGHEFVIRAVARLSPKFPNLKLFIVGEGDLQKSLQEQVSALGLEQQVFLIGPIRNDELFRWYSAADVTCLASSREGLPCVLLESLACSTPVVATEIDGTIELVNSQDVGLLVQQDEVSISDGLERALRFDWLRSALAQHVRSFALQQTVIVIEEILACSIQPRRKWHSWG
jgi:glycosyltransferase involved in cell wall biosynthesis